MWREKFPYTVIFENKQKRLLYLKRKIPVHSKFWQQAKKHYCMWSKKFTYAVMLNNKLKMITVQSRKGSCIQ